MESAFVFRAFNFVDNQDQQYHQFIQNIESFSKEGKNKNDDAPDCIAGSGLITTEEARRLLDITPLGGPAV